MYLLSFLLNLYYTQFVALATLTMEQTDSRSMLYDFYCRCDDLIVTSLCSASYVSC